MKPILTVGLNPSFQKTLVFPGFVPDTVNRAITNRLDAAGKGINVSRVLTQLGINCIHLTQLGGNLRSLFLELCEKDQLVIEWADSGSPLRFCYTLINREDQSITELVEEGERVQDQTGDLLFGIFEKHLEPQTGDEPDISALVISGSRAAGFSDTLLSEMVRRARAKSLPVILDIRGSDLLACLPFKPDIIKPNLFEFALTFAPDLVRGNEISAAGTADDTKALKDRIASICNEIYRNHHSQIVISRGKKPIWYAENGVLHEFEIDPAEPVNTTGSGDAFTAGLAGAYCSGASLREAVAEGARCGRLNALLIRPGVIKQD